MKLLLYYHRIFPDLIEHFIADCSINYEKDKKQSNGGQFCEFPLFVRLAYNKNCVLWLKMIMILSMIMCFIKGDEI